MTQDRFEHGLAVGLRAMADPARPAYLPDVISAIAAVPQDGRPARPAALGWRSPWGRALATALAATAAVALIVWMALLPGEHPATVASSAEPSPLPVVAEPVRATPMAGLEDVRRTGHERLEVNAGGTRLEVEYIAHPVCEGLDRVEVVSFDIPIDVAVYVGEVPGATCPPTQYRFVTTVELPAPILGAVSQPVSLIDIQGLIRSPCSAAGACRYGLHLEDTVNRLLFDAWFEGDDGRWMRTGPGAGLASTYNLRFGIVPLTDGPPDPSGDATDGSIGHCDGTFVAAPGQDLVAVGVRFAGDSCEVTIDGQPAPQLARAPIVALPSGATGGGCRGIGLSDTTVTGSPTDPQLAWLVRGDGTRQDVYWARELSARFTPGLEIVEQGGAVIYRDGEEVTGACTGERLLIGGGR